MVAEGYRHLTFTNSLTRWQHVLPASSANSLFLSDDDPRASAQLSRYRDYLGHEYEQVIIDCRKQLHVDAIAALTGTVIAGGELVLFGEPSQSVMWQRLQRCWSESVTSPAPTLPCLPTAAQSALIDAFQDTQSVHVLTAARGRGKSHVLGRAISQLRQRHPQQRILVTAPRRANARVLLNAADDIQFVAWDKLLQSKKGQALLVIDEAAGLPLWAIQQLCENYQPWLMATTVEGYEGCGRGFAVHFTEWVQCQYRHVTFHTLDTPLRWPAGDPLEAWLQDSLLLRKAQRELTQHNGIITCHASELPEQQLHQAFELLLEAHYQSSPNDLALLLDDEKQFLTLKYQQGELVGVCWHAIEGPVPQQLQDAILTGKRRPKGNLLPQAIGYFLQQPWALQTRWCRVVRIAVPLTHRRRHHASEMLEQTKAWALQHHCHAIGTSFGYSEQLANFWQKSGFAAVRTSAKIDRVSARHQHIRACWLVAPPPNNWSAIIEYGQAELCWILAGRTELASDNPIVTDIRAGTNAGHLPRNAVPFALNDC